MIPVSLEGSSLSTKILSEWRSSCRRAGQQASREGRIYGRRVRKCCSRPICRSRHAWARPGSHDPSSPVSLDVDARMQEISRLATAVMKSRAVLPSGGCQSAIEAVTVPGNSHGPRSRLSSCLPSIQNARSAMGPMTNFETSVSGKDESMAARGAEVSPR